MKKIIYSVLLGFVFLLVDINLVEAKSVTDVCYYKTDDNNFTFAVKAYDDGTSDAILMNSYNENSFPSNYNGHKESQDYRATWEDVGNVLNNSSCSKYMKYTVNDGDNDIAFSNSTPSLGTNDLLLVNYNFESTGSKCVYKGLDYRDEASQITLTVLIDENSVFTYYNDDLNYAMDRDIQVGSWSAGNEIEYNLDRDFYSSFIDHFYDESEGCPLIDTVSSTTEGVWIAAVDDTSAATNFGLISSDYNDSVTPEQELKSYPIIFDDGKNKIQFYIKTYDNKKEKICISTDNVSLKCTEMNYQDDEIFIHTGEFDGDWYMFKIKQEDISDIFKYETPGDYSTLIDPNPVYFNKGSYEIYYFSKTNDDSTIVSSDNGEEYKNQMCMLKPYLINKSSIAYELEFYDDMKTTADLYTIYDLPCDEWGYSYSLSCDEDCPYLITQSLMNIKHYCDDIYNNYSRDNEYIAKRINECISFNNFYSYLVEQGVVDDLGSNCGILSSDFVLILKKILDIVKIAGPLLALGLGTLDFIKTIASGDADKEMKNTFKRFTTRLIAAALLFLVPFILAFLMDVFLGNQDGYDSDNPFCSIVDWSE